MYESIQETMLGVGTTEPGVLETFGSEANDMFVEVLPVVLPVLAGIALGFFAIKVVRAILHI